MPFSSAAFCKDIKPVIDTLYPFEQAHEAYQHLAKGAFGKIVIKI